jgi:Response regulator containing CheY-like receiver, AAA-type ATPase, and DNA-binding domains
MSGLNMARHDRFITPDVASISLKPLSEEHYRNDSGAPRTTETAYVYAVDDHEELTELYTICLTSAGYRVRAFNDRVQALSALKVDMKSPGLLITDYFGHSTQVEEFMLACRVAHPGLQILMASGIHQTEFSRARPDRFVMKPFTARELLEEVRACLKNAI